MVFAVDFDDDALSAGGKSRKSIRCRASGPPFGCDR
jgi:hypothetical protein